MTVDNDKWNNDIVDARKAQEILRSAMDGDSRVIAAGFIFLASEVRDIFWLLDEKLKKGKEDGM